jgi:hypothetical protein
MNIKFNLKFLVLILSFLSVNKQAFTQGSDAFSTTATDITNTASSGDLSTAIKELGCSSGAYASNNGVSGATLFANNYLNHCQYTNGACSTTPASNQRNKTDFQDLWYKVVLPGGTTQMTLNLTGLTTGQYVAFAL